MSTTDDRRGSRGGSVREFLRRRWLAIVLVIVAIIFILQNRSQATVQLFGRSCHAAVDYPGRGVRSSASAAGLLLDRARNRRRVSRS